MFDIKALWDSPDLFYSHNWEGPSTPLQWNKWIALIDQFVQAKKDKDYSLSDKLRKELQSWQGTFYSDGHYAAMAEEGKFLWMSWEYTGKARIFLTGMNMRRAGYCRRQIREKLCNYHGLLSGVYDSLLKTRQLLTAEDYSILMQGEISDNIAFSVREKITGQCIGVYFFKKGSKLYSLRSATKAGWIFI